MEYRLERVAVDDVALDRSARMLRETYGLEQFTTALLRWQYAGNPSGTVLGYEAFAGTEVAAHYVTQPLVASVEGARERGLLSMNTATHPQHQGAGLFTRLATRTYETAAGEGYGFVVGVANANSTPGFVRRLGFQLVTPLDARIAIGPPPFPLQTAAFERMWDDESVRWRVSRPGGRYKVRRDTLVVPTNRPLISAALARAPFVERLPQQASSIGFRPLELWIGLEPHGAAPHRSLRIPDRLRPSPLNLIFLDLTTKRRRLDPTNVRFRALDFDAY